MSDQAIQGLVGLGLRTNEARTYVALLRHAPATAAEIADATGIARPKVYEVVKALEQRGFCHATGDRVLRFHPVDPELAVGEWTRRRIHERSMTNDRDEQLAEVVTRSLPVPHNADNDEPAGYMQVKVGVDRTLELFADINRRAEHRLDIVVTAPVIQSRDQWNRNEVEALRRNVSIRVIYPPDLVNDPQRYRPIVEAGGEVRTSTYLPLKMIVRDDGAEAIVSLVDHSDGDFVATSVAIGHRELATPFQLLFNRQWRQAQPLPD